MSSFYGGGAASNDSSGSGNTISNNSIFKIFTMDEEASEEAHPQGIAGIQEIIWKWEQGQTPDNLDDFFVPILKVSSVVGSQYDFPFTMMTYNDGSNLQRTTAISASYDNSQVGEAHFTFSYDEQNPGNINIIIDLEGGGTVVK